MSSNQGNGNVCWRFALYLAFCFTALSVGAAEQFPAKPVRIVVPFGAGTGWDVRVRQIAQIVSKSLGQAVIVENRPGAGGTLGAAYVAKARPDGYTLLAGQHADLAIASAIYPKLSYNPREDFAPIAQIQSSSLVLVCHPALSARSVKELVALAKNNGGDLSAASHGNATLSHVLLAEFNHRAGAEIIHVPYKNGAQGLTDVVGGRVSMMFDSYLTTHQFIRAGKLRALMVAGPRRNSLLPGIPTAIEAGFPTLAQPAWGGFLAPAKTPADIISRLNEEFVKAARSTEFRQILEKAGAQLATSSPEEFALLIRAQQEHFRKLAKETGIRPD